MTINEIFNLSIEMGIKTDFRGKQGVEKFLRRKKESFEKLLEKEKQEFDKDALKNPYLDSRIYHIAEDKPPLPMDRCGGKPIKRVLVGIDIDVAEILMAKEIGGIDLIIAHHPIGKGLAHLADVMDLQCDVLNFYGVPINIAEGLMKESIE